MGTTDRSHALGEIALSQYGQLLATYLLLPIRSSEKYEFALAQLEELMVPQPGLAPSLLIELLAPRVEAYEARQ